MNAKVFDHLVKYEVLYAMAVALILGAIGGAVLRMQLHHCPVCPKCPELVARSHVERDSIIIHDTVRVVKYAPSITVTTEPAEDPTNGDTVTYSVIDTMPDKAVIGFSITSCELPARRLPDLTHEAWYLAKPDRIRIINDTLTVQLPPLPCPPRWRRDITIGGICLGVGAGVTAIYLLR
jgi:hypothetical protein